MNLRFLATALVAAAFLSGCAHYQAGGVLPTASDSDADLQAPSDVVVRRAGDEFTFAYSGPLTRPNGDIDLTGDLTRGQIVELKFDISSAPAGFVFRRDPRDAIFIDFAQNVPPGGSPRDNYAGRQFTNFRLSRDRRTLFVTNLNNDGETYAYGLRFEYQGQLVMDDPKIRNHGLGGGGIQ